MEDRDIAAERRRLNATVLKFAPTIVPITYGTVFRLKCLLYYNYLFQLVTYWLVS